MKQTPLRLSSGELMDSIRNHSLVHSADGLPRLIWFAKSELASHRESLLEILTEYPQCANSAQFNLTS